MGARTSLPTALEALREKKRARCPVRSSREGIGLTRGCPEEEGDFARAGPLVDISLEEEWGDRAPRTRIVAIGSVDGMDASLLERTLEACIPVAQS